MSAPRRLLLRLGTTCNNRCEHCTIRDLAAQPERTTVEAIEELRRGRAGGCDELVLMRGEPLTRPDLLAILGEARALGYGHVQIQTNGRGLGAGTLLDDLVRAGVGFFEISLYGPDAAVHDAVAGVPGAFGETVAGIAACRARDLALLVTVPVVAANAVHLPATVALAARLGVGRAQLNFTRPLEGTERVVSNLEEGPREVRAAVLLGRELGLEMTVEALPPCILGGIDDALLRYAPAPVTIVDLHRTITDLGILRQIYRAPVAACRGCGETADCPVTWAPYLQELRQDRHLQPLPGPDAPEVDLCLVHPPWVVAEERVPRQWDLLALMPDAAPGSCEAEAGGEFSAVPLGLESIRRYLEARSAFTVRLANLAGLYLGAEDPHARLVQHLGRLKARVFAVDLHWLTHAQGALELVRLCRELHPGARTVVGGLSASHFAREILEGHAAVDYVLTGDGERPMLRLLEALLRGGDLTTVPNLWYRRHGRITRTRAAYFAEEESDYRGQPYVPVRRGCAYDCAHCGVGQTATAALFGPRARSRYAPEKVANEILPPPGATGRARLTGDPLLTFGAGGMRRFYGAIGTRGADLDLGVELQMMHGEAEIARLARTFRSVRLSLRPDSGDEGVRRRQGKPYSNDDLLRCVRTAAEHDNVAVAVTFLFGLAGDDAGSLDRSLALMRHISKIPSKRPIELRFLELWYLQPGSRALVDPEAHGYHAEWTDLASFRRQMAAPLFPGVVHFAPSALTRRGYVDLVLRKHLELDRLLVATGRRGARASQHVRAYVDAITAMTDEYERFGPGGALAPPAEARRLGLELKGRFLDRALGADAAPRASAPRVVSGPLPPAAFAPVPLAAERARAVLDALGLAGPPARRVLGGRGELRVESDGGALTLLPAGTRSRAAVRTDCFDLVAEGPLPPAVPAALQHLEREQPERLPL
ncbi:MAG TPA: radical SAM protein, partial [Polyangia bacterium]